MAADDKDEWRSVRVTIEGWVQGVAYRAWTADQARALGLSGWVRNRRDGTVEALFAGPREAIEQMLARCAEGPAAARVETVNVVADNEDAPTGFRIERTV